METHFNIPGTKRTEQLAEAGILLPDVTEICPIAGDEDLYLNPLTVTVPSGINPSQPDATLTGNTAVRDEAIPQESVSTLMTTNKKLYQATMALTRMLLRHELLTKEEYRIIDTKFQEKYSPDSGTLLADIDLLLPTSCGC